MGTMRIMSRYSKVYHNSYCHHVRRIHKKNGKWLPWWEARKKGYRPCSCCSRISYFMDCENGSIRYYRKAHQMEFKYVKNALYVKTEIGCWKIMYSAYQEKMLLFHRNTTRYPCNFMHPEKECYHVQSDALNYHTLQNVLQYIFEHDKYKKAEKNGEKIVFKNKKYKKQAEQRKRRKQIRKVEKIFKQLEKERKAQDRNL